MPRKSKVDYVGKAVLAYFKRNEGAPVFLNECAEEVGVHVNTVATRVKEFRALGLLKVVGNRRYKVCDES